MGHHGRRVGSLDALTVAPFFIGCEWFADLQSRRLLRIFERMVDSFGASGYGLAGLRRYRHRLYAGPGKERAGAFDATLLAACRPRSCPDRVGATGPVYGWGPTPVSKVHRNCAVYGPERVHFRLERMDLQALLDWLNVYMEAMAQLVMSYGGVVDDFIGDSIKADFGVPLPRTTEAAISRDAVAAVDCALAMERELKHLNTVWQQQNLPTVEMRIGIFTGPVVAGSLGSAQRLKYTTVGDTVNIASPLESFDKELVNPELADSPCRILIGETTQRYIGHQFQTKIVGEANLKGKDERVTIYRVIGRAEWIKWR